MAKDRANDPKRTVGSFAKMGKALGYFKDIADKGVGGGVVVDKFDPETKTLTTYKAGHGHVKLR